MIGSTSCLYRCILVLAFAALNLFNLVTCILAPLAWSYTLLWYPDLLNLNPSILALSRYSILLFFYDEFMCFSSRNWYYCEFINFDLDFPFSFILVLFFDFSLDSEGKFSVA